MNVPFKLIVTLLYLSMASLVNAQNLDVQEDTSRTVRTVYGTSATLSKKRAVIGLPESFMAAPVLPLRAASEQVPQAIYAGVRQVKAIGTVIERANTLVRKMRLPESVELATGTHNVITVPSAAETLEIDAMTSETDERLQKVIERDRQIREDVEGSVL